jgi:hypothetical protein
VHGVSTGGGRTRLGSRVSSKYRAVFARIGGVPEMSTSYRQLHDFAGRQQRPGGFLARNHEMAEPGREPVAGVVFHRTNFGGSAQSIRDAFRRSLVIGGETYAHMTIIENGVIRPIGLFNLIERLGDQERFEAIARHEGEHRFEKIEAPEGRKLVQHEQHAWALRLTIERASVNRRPI